MEGYGRGGRRRGRGREDRVEAEGEVEGRNVKHNMIVRGEGERGEMRRRI